MATGETFESFMGGFRTAVRAALLCAGIKVEEDAPRERFAAALLQLQEQGKQAVVLIDEYDAPICHALNKPELCGNAKSCKMSIDLRRALGKT